MVHRKHGSVVLASLLTGYVTVSVWKVPSKDSFDSLSALDIAEQMTYLDHQIFMAIKSECVYLHHITNKCNKKAQLSLTNPRDVKVCQKLLQFDVLTTLSLTYWPIFIRLAIVACRNLRNPAKFTKNSNLRSSRSSKVIDLGVNGKPIIICDFILVINSNFSRIC